MAFNPVKPGSQEEQVGRLILAAVIVMFMEQVPLGGILFYPFTILTTWFHEMGHGLTAMLMGDSFNTLVILPSGSGYAEISGDSGAIASALISAGGPLGPSIVGALLILASARRDWWRPALYIMAGAIGVSILLWVRSWVGISVLALDAVAMVVLAQKGPDWAVRFGLQFLGVLAAMSMFRDWDYLFSESAVINGQQMVSDTGAMEDALFLPHWLWAAAIIIASGAMIGAALKTALSGDGRAKPH